MKFTRQFNYNNRMKRLFVIILLGALYPLTSQAGDPAEKLLYEKNSLYQYIAVIENTQKKERYIFNTKKDYNQGGIYVDAPDKLLFEYTQIAFVSLGFLDREPEDVLFVGLGAGSMVRYISRYYPDANVDVAEIDPDILSVAKKYFHFKETPKLKVHLKDGRIFIKRNRTRKYDLIILDAYQNDYIPFHLTTVEFLREVKGVLKEGGVVVSNITSPNKNKFFYSMIETFKEEFPHLYIYRGRKSNNYIFITLTGKKKISKKRVSKRAKELQAAKQFDFDLYRVAWDSYGYYTDFQWKGDVLTDDFAPVNMYRQMKAK